jgi:hypothetical protein
VAAIKAAVASFKLKNVILIINFKLKMSSSNFIKCALQKYPLNSAVTAKSGQRNLIELVSRFPKQGSGMKVYRKTWPENSYWEVYYANMTAAKAGRLYGIKFWQGERISNKIDKIPGVMKRGVWQYDINDAFKLTDRYKASAGPGER